MSGFPDKFIRIDPFGFWAYPLQNSLFSIQYSLFKFSPSFGGEILNFERGIMKFE